MSSSLVHPFDELTEAALRRRHSAKWKVFPDDVLPAWVAEMDFPLADPIRRVLRQSIAMMPATPIRAASATSPRRG